MNLPVIATNVGDSAELIGSNGIVIEPRNVQAIVAAVDRIVDSSFRASLADGARRRMTDDFCFDAAVAKYAKFYRGQAGRD